MSRADVEASLTMGDAVARVVRSRERFPLASASEETAGMVEEGERVIARARLQGRRVRSWYRGRVYTVTVDVLIDAYGCSLDREDFEMAGIGYTVVGRGSTLLDAVANLGCWEAW